MEAVMWTIRNRIEQNMDQAACEATVKPGAYKGMTSHPVVSKVVSSIRAGKMPPKPQDFAGPQEQLVATAAYELAAEMYDGQLRDDPTHGAQYFLSKKEITRAHGHLPIWLRNAQRVAEIAGNVFFRMDGATRLS